MPASVSAPPASKLRIFLADDHTMIRTGLKSLINADAGMIVVGEADNGEAAVAQVTRLKPDILVLDVTMPKLNGPQVAAKLKASCPQLRILALSVHEDRGYLRAMLEAGASGYALKRAASEDLQRAIRVVATGGIYVDPSVADELIRCLAPERMAASDLSERETSVLRSIAEGYSAKEIAVNLGISVKSVDTYKTRSMEKLGLRSRVDIVRHAKQAGWFH